MPDAYIVDAVRTAGGRKNGRLASIHANDLGAIALDALIDRTGIDGAVVDDVIFGCVTQAGEQAFHIGRRAVLASRTLPNSVPAVSIDRQCGSSQQSIHFAAQAVMSGTQDVVIAGGVESMTRVPMGSSALKDTGVSTMSDTIKKKYGVEEFSQFLGAEMIAKKYEMTREDVDLFSFQSHQKATKAIETNFFDTEITPVDVTIDGEKITHRQDEGVRLNASLEGMKALNVLTNDGVLTAASASQICDGSSAILVVSERALKEYNLMPKAKIVNLTVTAGDPVVMLEEPLFATDKALKRSGLNISDIDFYEINEAFAPVPMAWLAHTGADPERLNVNGGAIALGHPLGATGTKLMTTLINTLQHHGKKYGLQAMCEGGGIANVTIIEVI